MKSYNWLFLISLLFCSCIFHPANRYVYAAQPANVPYFKQKGDAKITGYSSDGTDFTQKDGGTSIQGAYAVSNHWAITAAFNHWKQKQVYYYDSSRYYSSFSQGYVRTNVFDSSLINYKNNTFELGGGYYTALNKKKTITYNLYGGVAIGKYAINDAGLDSNNKNYTRFNTNNVTKWYLQGAFNFMPSPYFYCSIGGNFSVLNFSSKNTTYSNQELEYFYLNKINNKSFFMWEPYFNMQIGVPKINWVKLDMQLSWSTGFSRIDYPKVRTFIGSIGGTINIGEALRKVK